MTPSTINMYPVGLDFAWMAIDKGGYVAVFTTAGCGPIPLDHLDSSRDTFEFDVEREINELAERCGAKMLVDLPRPDSFVSLAQRGVFTFDWFDIHRSEQKSTKMYGAMAVPKAGVRPCFLPCFLLLFPSLVLKNNREKNTGKLGSGLASCLASCFYFLA